MYDNRDDRLSDREKLEHGQPAPCAICGRVIQPSKEPYLAISGTVARIARGLVGLPTGVHTTMEDAIICSFCAEQQRDPTNDFRRPDKASAYEYALKLARTLPDAVLSPEPQNDEQEEAPDTPALDYLTAKLRAVFPNMMDLHIGQVAAKACRVERGRRRAKRALEQTQQE